MLRLKDTTHLKQASIRRKGHGQLGNEGVLLEAPLQTAIFGEESSYTTSLPRCGCLSTFDQFTFCMLKIQAPYSQVSRILDGSAVVSQMVAYLMIARRCASVKEVSTKTILLSLLNLFKSRRRSSALDPGQHIQIACRGGVANGYRTAVHHSFQELS
jgi:hypothetical protein